MTDKYIIQKNIPIPARDVPNTLAAVLRKMEVGDSIDVPKNSNVYHYAKRVGKKVCIRRMKNGETEFYRLWVTGIHVPQNA